VKKKSALHPNAAVKIDTFEFFRENSKDKVKNGQKIEFLVD